MDINTVRAFFMWCTIMNAGILMLASLILVFAGNRVFRIHSKWIPMTRDAFDIAIYCLLGFFKIVVIVFNLVPYIALVIIG
ncbi:MAG: DUF6868 family protein [Verrucomicrobiota bacterium]